MRHLLVFLLLLAAVPLRADPSSGFLDVTGGKLWYEIRGEGPPLVLLHDGLVPSGTWDDQMPAFARLFRTVRYDRRGYGRSEAAKEAFSDVDDLHAVLESLKIDRAVLVGCSNGAKLAVDYALAHPERVGTLVLVGPVVSGLPYSEHFQRRGMENFQSAKGLIEAWVQDRYILDPASTRARERLRALLKGSPTPLVNRGIASLAAKRPAVGRLSEIKVPTLILVGASDIPDVHAHAGALEAGIQGSRRAVISDAGHLIHLEKPDLFNETVLTFLRPGDAAASCLKSLRPLEENRNLFILFMTGSARAISEPNVCHDQKRGGVHGGVSKDRDDGVGVIVARTGSGRNSSHDGEHSMLQIQRRERDDDKDQRQQRRHEDGQTRKRGDAAQEHHQERDTPGSDHSEKPCVDGLRLLQRHESLDRSRVEKRGHGRERNEGQNVLVGPAPGLQGQKQQPYDQRQDEHVRDGAKPGVLPWMRARIVPIASDAGEPGEDKAEREIGLPVNGDRRRGATERQQTPFVGGQSREGRERNGRLCGRWQHGDRFVAQRFREDIPLLRSRQHGHGMVRSAAGLPGICYRDQVQSELKDAAL